MAEKLVKLNRELRKAVLLVGGIILIFKLAESKNKDEKQSYHGYQTREFDDIW